MALLLPGCNSVQQLREYGAYWAERAAMERYNLEFRQYAASYRQFLMEPVRGRVGACLPAGVALRCIAWRCIVHAMASCCGEHQLLPSNCRQSVPAERPTSCQASLPSCMRLC